MRATVGYVVTILVVVAGLVAVLHRTTHDPQVEQVRNIFVGLAKGQLSVQDRIDWIHLTALGMNVGETYERFPTEIDRAKYREAFIKGFSQGFRATRARASSFVNWRVYERKENTLTVAADLPKYGQTMLLVVSEDANRRLEAIQWLGGKTNDHEETATPPAS